LARLPDSPMHC